MSLLRPRPTPVVRPEIVVAEAITPTVDPDDHLYRRAGTINRDLNASVLWRAMELCASMYRQNPLANRIIKIIVAYMAGNGFNVRAYNPDVQAVVDEFWTAPRNNLERLHRGFARDFLIFGEGHHPVAVDDMGSTTFGFIDPTSIDRITLNPSNNMLLDAVHLKRDGSGRTPPPLSVVHQETDPMDPSAGLMVGDTFAWLFDRLGASTRGAPFLLPVLDWLDAYDQTIWELLERTKATRAFFWDVMAGNDPEDVEEAQKIWGTTPPRSGSVRFRTSSMEISAAQPQLGAYEDVNTGRFILRHIAAGAGVPPHWLGDPEDANRSTAESMDAPTLRSLEDVQTLWRYQIGDVIRFAVDQKVAAGMLPRIVQRHDEDGRPVGDDGNAAAMEPARDLIEVEVPSITDDDVTAAAAALAQVAQAFVALDVAGAGDENVLRKVVRKMLPALGVPADELPDPDDDETTDAEMDDAVEAMIRRARRTGAWDRLVDELAAPDVA